MINLDGIESASGLSAADKKTLRLLIDVSRSVATRNSELMAYYESEHVTPGIGINNIPETVQVGARCSWAEKAVTSVAERVRMNGFTFSGDYRDPDLEKIERANQISASFNSHIATELVHGCIFATVNREGERVTVRMHTAETSAAVWDEAEQRIGAGFVVADSGYTDWSPTSPVPTRVNMHLPGAVVVLRRTGAASWSAERLATPLDRPMMEALTFRATGKKRFGQTRITKTVRFTVDEVERTLRYMAVSGALYAIPKDILAGLTEKQFETMSSDKWSSAVTALLLTTRDKNGNIPQYTRLQGSSPQPYIDTIAAHAKLFSGATGVPLNSLGIVQDNPSSAEAIAAQREDICVAAEDCIESNRAAMRNVALMAMAVAGNKTIDQLTDDQLTVMPDFKNPMRPSLAATADAYAKIAGVLDGFAQTREFLSGQGFTLNEAESIKSQLNANANQQALLAIMGGEESGSSSARKAG